MAWWHAQAWHREDDYEPVTGVPHEYGVVQYGVQAVDYRGGNSGAPSAISVFFCDAPLVAAQTGISVAASVVTLKVSFGGQQVQ